MLLISIHQIHASTPPVPKDPYASYGSVNYSHPQNLYQFQGTEHESSLSVQQNKFYQVPHFQQPSGIAKVGRWESHHPNPYGFQCIASILGGSQGYKHKREPTGGKKEARRKKRKYELGHQFKLSTVQRVRIRCENGVLKTKLLVGNEILKAYQLFDEFSQKNEAVTQVKLYLANTKQGENGAKMGFLGSGTEFHVDCVNEETEVLVEVQLFDKIPEETKLSNEVHVFDKISKKEETKWSTDDEVLTHEDDFGSTGGIFTVLTAGGLTETASLPLYVGVRSAYIYPPQTPLSGIALGDCCCW